MKNICFALGLLLSFTGFSQQLKNSQAASSTPKSKSYDKEPKASVPLIFSWNNTEIGFSSGAIGYWGDLQNKLITMSQAGVCGGLMLRNPLHANVAVRFSANYGTIQAKDSKSNDPERIKRNLSFRSRLVEYGLSGEFLLPITHKVMGSDGITPSKIAYPIMPYFVVGMHLFHFNPQAEYKGTWYDLKPLNTEGQNLNRPQAKNYSLTQISIPLGFGLKYKLTSRANLAVEFSGRKTLTDSLDDVSTSYPDLAAQKFSNGDIGYKLSWRGNEINGQENKVIPEGTRRGNSDNNDWYVLSTVSFRVKLAK